MRDLIGALIAVGLWTFVGVVFWRFPAFRRDFVAYWRPAALSARMEKWAAEQRRSR